MIQRLKPVKHIVHKHSRSNAPIVHQYERGSRKPTKESTSRLTGKRLGAVTDDKSHGGFEVTIKYDVSPQSSGVIKAPNYREGLSRGLEELAYTYPRQITLRKMEPWTEKVSKGR